MRWIIGPFFAPASSCVLAGALFSNPDLTAVFVNGRSGCQAKVSLKQRLTVVLEGWESDSSDATIATFSSKAPGSQSRCRLTVPNTVDERRSLLNGMQC